MRCINIPPYRFGSGSRWFCSHESRRAEKRIFPLILLALVFLASQLCVAQDLDSVTIAGHVTDQNGAVISEETKELLRRYAQMNADNPRVAMGLE